MFLQLEMIVFYNWQTLRQITPINTLTDLELFHLQFRKKNYNIFQFLAFVNILYFCSFIFLCNLNNLFLPLAQLIEQTKQKARPLPMKTIFCSSEQKPESSGQRDEKYWKVAQNVFAQLNLLNLFQCTLAWRSVLFLCSK